MSAIKKIKEDQMKEEGVMSTVNNLFDKARGVLADFVPGGDILKSMNDAGMSDNEVVAFFQNVMGPLGYVAGAVPTLIHKAKNGDPQAQQALVFGAQKAMQAKGGNVSMDPSKQGSRALDKRQGVQGQGSPFPT